jgi:hypothetical protein
MAVLTEILRHTLLRRKMSPSLRSFAKFGISCSIDLSPLRPGSMPGDPEADLRTFPSSQFELQYGSVLEEPRNAGPRRGAARWTLLVSRRHGNIAASHRRPSGRSLLLETNVACLRHGKEMESRALVDITATIVAKPAASAVVIATPADMAANPAWPSNKLAPLFSRIDIAGSGCVRMLSPRAHSEDSGRIWIPGSSGRRLACPRHGVQFRALRRPGATRNGLLH